MRVAVVGPGAIGGMVGALLARSGHDVCFVARPASVDTLNHRGMTVESAMFGRFTVAVRATERLTGPVDVCVLAVKTPDLPAALDAVPRHALGGGLALPLLNGWEHLEQVGRHFGAHTVIGGAIRVEATRSDATTVEHLSPFVRLTMGLHPGSAAVAAALEGAGITTEEGGTGLAAVWEKLTFLSPFALATARWGAGIGHVRHRHRADLEALVTESAAVGATFGATSTPAGLLRFIDALPPGMTSSLRRDLEARRPHELDAIGGGVVRAGQAAGIAVETHARLIAEIHRQDTGHAGVR